MNIVPSVSVVIPSFNRAHLLKKILPTYLQEDVLELILVDDCSQDNTGDVVKELQVYYPQIRYYRNEKNSKQPFTKNIGIEKARGAYIYFGDDDSILTENSIHILLETLKRYDVDCVGARALYAGNYVKMPEMDIFLRWMKQTRRGCSNDICDLKNLKINFRLDCQVSIPVPVLSACALIKSDIAKLIKFDTNYIGSAYREETDFFIRVTLAGYKIMYQPLAIQLNLPPIYIGSRRNKSRIFFDSAIYCNRYFIDKNWKAICDKFGFSISKEQIKKTTERKIHSTSRKISGNILKDILRRIYFRCLIVPRYSEKTK
jgi:glycosyltransferase involved in cell wall biosynthesis